MTPLDSNSLEQFLQDASERLQFLREYAALPVEPTSTSDDLARLYDAAHALAESASRWGFPLFSDIAGRLAHVFQYARKAQLSPDTYGPLTEFLADAISVLEFDLLQISSDGNETTDDIAGFKHRYAFAFGGTPASSSAPGDDLSSSGGVETQDSSLGSEPNLADDLPEDDDVPREVLDFFIPEAEEHLQIATQCLLGLESTPDTEEIHRLFRSVHTIKGSAAQVGLRRLGAVAHRLEDLIGLLRDGALPSSPEITDVCLQTLDALRKFLHRQWANDDEMRLTVGPLLARIAQWIPEEFLEDTAVSGEEARPEASEVEVAPAASAHASPGGPGKIGERGAQAKSVRISLSRLDDMMNSVGELVINRTRLVGRMAELKKLVEVLGISRKRLSDKVAEFQEKYEFTRLGIANSEGGQAGPRKTGGLVQAAQEMASGGGWRDFSDLEMDRYDDFNILSRSLTEISADISEVLSQLSGFVGRVGGDIDEFTKLGHHLQDEITEARMVPIGNLYTRLSRTARDAAKICGKAVDLELVGEDTRLDNSIVQQITDPLIHLVRNAIAHGIEDAPSRERAGKSARGKVTVRAFHRGNHVFIEVQDDGGGLEYDRIRQTAVRAGLVSAPAAELLSESELRAFLFHPGFTTASSKNEVAGRGVGLDVVRSNVHSLNGEIEIRSESGRGTCFGVKVPLTLIISQALFIRSGTTVLAMPLAVVEEIRRLRPEEIEDVGGKLLTKVRGVVTEVVRLDTALALPPIEPINGYMNMVIVRAAGRQVGVVVEEVLGKDEVVIKNLGQYMRRVKLFPGATISTDGSLILLVDVNRLAGTSAAEVDVIVPSASAARIFGPGAMAVASGSIPAAAVDEPVEEKVVVIADDSISVRKFVGRILEKAGYCVKLASDGLEAAELVAQVGCHLVITDIEMPRMNGYELMSHLRQDPATRRIPVLVVTSRAGAKHRERAIKEGAASFLTKPVQEEQLLAVVDELMNSAARQRRPAAPALDLA
ncbi:MAG TPA: hybrid sensor histidine kinase/response regulator [Candidatus Acidoferrum sp.]|jgi:chemosensory pili system protein ChpA (sensor histidine kinase/response regulator)|nr:hybrid sensor histidine kinase/response regulator [Candidatus Acidoferrum sp.]